MEGDSFAWHRSPTALDIDRERDLALVLSGWRALRFTHHQVTRRSGLGRRGDPRGAPDPLAVGAEADQLVAAPRARRRAGRRSAARPVRARRR